MKTNWYKFIGLNLLYAFVSLRFDIVVDLPLTILLAFSLAFLSYERGD